MNFHGRLHDQLVFNRRTAVLSERIAEALPPEASVLDVGCGDGTIDRLIMARRPDVTITGIDIMVRSHTEIPVQAFDGQKIPLEDDSVDCVLFVDVLHHTEDPNILLGEAVRVARRSVVIKDHCRDGLLAGPTLRVMDWFGNAPHGVVLPYNYWPEQRWREAFAHLGRVPVLWQRDLDLYPAPASWVFDRGLHFLCRLEKA